MDQKLRKSDPVFGVSEDLLEHICSFWVVVVRDREIHRSNASLSLVFVASVERGPSKDELVDNDAKTPYVDLLCICILCLRALYYLWGHPTCSADL